ETPPELAGEDACATLATAGKVRWDDPTLDFRLWTRGCELGSVVPRSGQRPGRLQLRVNPAFQWPKRTQQLVDARRIDEPNPHDREEHDKRSPEQGNFRADLVRPLGRHFEDAIAGAVERVEEVDIE